jgi:hypothetical protein
MNESEGGIQVISSFRSLRLGHIPPALATLDLRLAVHRGRAHGTGVLVLHPVHRDQSLHNVRHGHRRLLRPRHRHDLPLLAHLAGDGETAEGPAEPPGRQAGRQQAEQLEVRLMRLARYIASTPRSRDPFLSFLSFIEESLHINLPTRRVATLHFAPQLKFTAPTAPSLAFNASL